MTAKKVYIIRHNDARGTHHDNISKLTSYHHDVTELTLEEALERDKSDALMLIMDVAPDNFETITALRLILKSERIKKIPILFILSSMRRVQIIQANTLGATDFLSHPIDRNEFQKKLKAICS